LCTNIKNGFRHIDKINIYKQLQINGFTHEQNRKHVRDQIVDLFKSEQAGTGKGEDSTRVIYCVEQIDEEIIYLQRPAILNKGFDFTVNTKNYSFFSPTVKQPNRYTKTPSHKSIELLLNKIKSHSLNDLIIVKEAIEQIYFCIDPDDISLVDLTNDSIENIKIETILKVVKWLFIEQDITYWSFSGRAMLFNGLQNV
jgi:hypothetical protein